MFPGGNGVRGVGIATPRAPSSPIPRFSVFLVSHDVSLAFKRKMRSLASNLGLRLMAFLLLKPHNNTKLKHSIKLT
jgi:hypothetical protein